MNLTLQTGIRSLRNLISPQNALYDNMKELIKKDNKKRISFELTKNRTYKAEMQQDELRLAIEHAEDPMRPDRTMLLAIYKEVMRDPHLLSQIRTNILKVIGSPWALFKEGTDEIDEDSTRILQRQWFQNYRYEFHLAKYFGHSLIEFQEMKPTSATGLKLEFKNIKVFPREHVRPETGEILLNPTNEKGIPYREEPWNTWLIEIGTPYDLGLLNIAAREVIWKNYSRTDWSRMCEKFGLPLLAIKAATRNDDELEALEKMASNFGSNLWVILDDEDEVEIKERTSSDGHKIFEDKVRFCDEQNSKLISGQTGTSDQKSFVGAAQVQENILNEYMEEAMRAETYHNNDDLKEFLIKHGYPLKGLEFRYLAFVNTATGEEPVDNTQMKNFLDTYGVAVRAGTISPQKMDEIKMREMLGLERMSPEVEKAWKKDEGVRVPITLKGENEPDSKDLLERQRKLKKDKEGSEANFTKPSPKAFGEGLNGLPNALASTLSARVDALYTSACCLQALTALETKGIADLEKLANQAAKRIYDKKLKAGGVDEKLWQAQVARLWSGVTKGYGKNLPTIQYGSPDHIMLTQLRYNTQVFAAFKNHHNVNELAKALVTTKGKVRSFAEFKKEAGLINKKYNKNWIKTEYNQAIQAGRNAERWQKLDATKDIFPNVIYKAVNDGKTSQICIDLNGGIWAINDPILDTIAPGNHWGCRSFLQKTRKEAAPKETGQDIRKEFKTNPGKTGHPFSNKHPYYKTKDQYKDAAKRVFGVENLLGISPAALQRNLRIWESLNPKDYAKIPYPQSGGFTAVHKLAHKADVKDNLFSAKILAKNGYAVEILAHKLITGKKNPEYNVFGKLSDLKTPVSLKKAIDNSFISARNQGLNECVINLKNVLKIGLNDLANQLKNSMRNRSINNIDLIRGDSVIRITRKMYENGTIEIELKKLYK